MTTPVLVATSLSAAVRLPDGSRLGIFDGVSLSVGAGEAIAITGPSGSGKTSLVSQLGLMASIASGRLVLGGTDVSRLGDRRRSSVRNRAIGFVFQSYSLVPHLTAAQNVALPLLYGNHVPRTVARRRVAALLAAVGLDGRGRSRPAELSGGEQQRVAIARALIREPLVVIADEPTGALDVQTARTVLAVMRGAAADRGTALVVATHDRAIAAGLDRELRLVDGQLVAAPCAG